MNTIQLYTTQIVEGNPIEAYLGVVTANQVAGTGFFTDLTASFSDLFGGNSGAYRKVMNDLYEQVIRQLTDKACRLGANGIVGITIDYDNISAKSMSMFMVSVHGTAVRFKKTETTQLQQVTGSITSEKLECELNKKVFVKKLEKGCYLSEEEWKYVLSHEMPELANSLLTSYDNAKNGVCADLLENVCISNFPHYLSKLPYQVAVELMYSPKIYDSKKYYFKLIKEYNLFNAAKILEVAKEQRIALAIDLLGTNKASYNLEDLKDMKELSTYLNNLPDTGKIEDVKSSIFSSGGMKFICQCGFKNDPKNKYCSSCGRNIKGITRDQQYAIDLFTEKVQILENLLK